MYCDVYFTDPHCAWQKGREEAQRPAPGGLSQGRSLSRIASAALKRSPALINARPREVLNVHSAQELWDFEFHSCCSLAVHRGSGKE